MKILLTGGGSGGHFYPLIAVAESINRIAKEKKLVDVKLFYMAPQPYDERVLFENNITFVKCDAGKLRRYFSLLNVLDFLKMIWGSLRATWTLYWIYPDVVFGKGGYVSFPVLFASWFLNIPVIIHESDSVPGKVNRWAGKFAKKIALSYSDAAEYFSKKEKIALTGNPVRQEVLHAVKDGSYEYLNLEKGVPVILILGGSQGALAINQCIYDILGELVEKYQVIHQAGKKNIIFAKSNSEAVLLTNKFKHRYHVYDSLNSLTLRMAAGAADLIVSRAGSTIFEIAVWGVPSIIIPIEDSNGDHQRLNAFNYARSGAAVVIEEANLTPHLLFSEIDRLMEDPANREKMRQAALGFARLDAADLIAKELVAIGLEHEK